MSLSANQIPVYAINPVTFVGDLNAATAGALGTSTNAVTAYTAGASGARVYSLIATTTDSSAVNLFIQIQRTGAGSVSPIAQVAVLANSGNTAGTLGVDCLDPTVAKGLPIDNTGKRYIEMGPSDLLLVSVVANMGGGKHCYVAGMGATYS